MGVGCHALLQGIFSTHGLNPYCPALAGGFFTTSATWEAPTCTSQPKIEIPLGASHYRKPGTWRGRKVALMVIDEFTRYRWKFSKRPNEMPGP